MSAVLLDTHVLLWVLTDSKRLGRRTRGRLAAEVAYVSSVSLWEVEIKRSLGKLVVPGDLNEAVTSSGLRELPLRWAHVSGYPAIELPHRDPVDRMLIAQAGVERLDFLTADRQILGADLSGVFDARD